MVIEDLMTENKISQYRLSRISGVPQTTISDLCSGKTDVNKCSAGTLYKIAKALGVTVDSIIENTKSATVGVRVSFETFKSNTCHHVKDMGDVDFVVDTLKKDTIRKLYVQEQYPESFYLLAMVDYISYQNGIPVCKKYNDIRKRKLKKTIYPAGVLVQAAVLKSSEPKIEAEKAAIPEFMRYNIVESEVRNLV